VRKEYDAYGRVIREANLKADQAAGRIGKSRSASICERAMDYVFG
jgi:hypothetical protein